MPKDIDQLEFRVVAKDEVKASPSPRRKQLTVEALAKRLINPETEKPIEIGEAVELGPFDSVEEGRNWLGYYLPDAYKHPLLGWGKVKTEKGHTKSPVMVEAKPRDGKVYFWVIRVTD